MKTIMLNLSKSQSSKPNNIYIGCPLIPSKSQFEVNEKSHLVCHNCKQTYKIISFSTHFNKCLAKLEKKGLDPIELR